MARVPGVAAVALPTPGHPAGLVSASGRSSLVVATLRATAVPGTMVPAIQASLRGRPGVLLGGGDVANARTGKQALADLGLAEALAFPLLALLVFVIFPGIAALLPIAVGGMAVMGKFVVLRLVNMALPLPRQPGRPDLGRRAAGGGRGADAARAGPGAGRRAGRAVRRPGRDDRGHAAAGRGSPVCSATPARAASRRRTS
jgi:hypothetical protein